MSGMSEPPNNAMIALLFSFTSAKNPTLPNIVENQRGNVDMTRH